MDEQNDIKTLQVNPGYALGQIAKALTTAEEHADAETRERAYVKVDKWLQVLHGVLGGSIAPGSRTPVAGVPAWATLEIVTGGFATGKLLAGGPLLDHERELLSELGQPEDNARRTLNAYFLTEEGMSRLRWSLVSGRYEIKVPEEGALLVVAWLLDNGRPAVARNLIDEIVPFFDRLRFYPMPAGKPRRFGARVYLQDVASTIKDLERIEPNAKILTQKEVIEVWAPLYDRTIELFLETVDGEPPRAIYGEDGMAPKIEGGWPGRTFSADWNQRATQVLDEYAGLRQEHSLCGKPERKKENFPQLRAYLRKCIEDVESLTDRDVARLRTLLARSLVRRGAPGSATWQEVRSRQSEQISGPTYQELAKVVASRLQQHPRDSGIESLEAATHPLTEEESRRFKIAASAHVPEYVRRKVERCLIDTADALIERGVITSGETLARVLPQVTSGLRAAGITDPSLRQLYAAIYRAFRQRRSLLLLNLEHQAQLEELPWVAAIDKFRRDDLSSRELARETLAEIVALTLVSFPHAIIPNKLLQELRALAKQAKLDMPIVDEVAADIFMGEFSAKFVEAAKRAADLMEGTLYATYYEIDGAAERHLPKPLKKRTMAWFRRPHSTDPFVNLCSSRAGVTFGGWNVAVNGMIIEQQQILTTQNLAVLFDGLNLADALQNHLEEMARRCFIWICKRQQMKPPKWHAYLIMLKNTAYAWRQMIFCLSMLPDKGVRRFIAWADEHLAQQSQEFQTRFAPAMSGLRLAMEGHSPESPPESRRLLGWTTERHWLLGPKPQK